MNTFKYWHTAPGASEGLVSDEVIEYRDRKLLLAQGRRKGEASWVVTAFVQDTKIEGECRVSACYRVPESERQAVEKFARERGYEGPMNF